MNLKETIRSSTLLHSFVNLCIIDGINYLLPFIALPFLYRTLGAQSYGIIASAYSFFTFAIIFIDFGFGLSATREVSLNANNKTELNRIVNSTLIAKSILLLSVLLISFVVIECSSFREYRYVFYLMFGIPIGSCFFPVWFFQGMEKMAYMTTTSTLAKLLSFVPMFILVKGPQDVEWVAVFYSAGFIISGFISLYVLRKKFGIKLLKPRKEYISQSFATSTPYFLSRVSASLYSVGNTILIGLLCGTLMAGYYDSAQKLLAVFTATLSPLTTALYPYMIKRHNIRLFKKILWCLALLGLTISIVCIFSAPSILRLLFGEAPDTTVTVFRILFLSTAFLIPCYLLGYPYLAALGHVKFTNVTVIIAGAIYLLSTGIIVALDKFSVFFAAIIYVACEFAVFVMRIYGVIKYKLL